MVRANAANADPDGSGGLPAGVYHVVVESSSVEAPPNNNKVKLVFSALAGRTAAGAENVRDIKKTEFVEFGATEDWKERRFFEVCVALGLCTMEQWRAWREAKSVVDLPLDNCRGAQCCIQVEQRPGKDGTKNAGKMFDNITRFWPIASAEASHVPKDMAWAGAAVQQQQAMANQAQAPLPQQPQQPTAPVASPAAPVAPPPAGGSPYSSF